MVQTTIKVPHRLLGNTHMRQTRIAYKGIKALEIKPILEVKTAHRSQVRTYSLKLIRLTVSLKETTYSHKQKNPLAFSRSFRQESESHNTVFKVSRIQSKI